MVLHATQFIFLSTRGYKAVWWRLFHAPNASEWANILCLVQLLLTLPISNGKLQRIFSTLKVLKSEKRSLLRNDTLDDLLVLNTDHIPLTDLNPDRCTKMWRSDKSRGLNQHQRKEYKKKSTTSDTDQEAGDTRTDSEAAFTRIQISW